MWLHGATLNSHRVRAARPPISALWLWGTDPMPDAQPNTLTAHRFYGGDPLIEFLATPGQRRVATFSEVDATADHVVVELAPLTGRMHQLRVQAAWRGHPVLGDVIYGSTRAFGPAAELPRDRVVALHARSLALAHPFTKQALTLVAPVPEYWGTGDVS